MSFHFAASRALLLASSAIAFAVPAHAQDVTDATPETTAAEAQATSPSAPDSATSDIIVTARRFGESLQKVPASISAFNEKALDRIQATDPTGLQGAVPNLNIVQGRGSSNATNIYIRGIGQPDALQTFDPAVGVYVDDVYMSRIRGTQLDLLDIERIEVLRGPQGTLYGKNTIGGALKVITHRPGKIARGSAALTVGTHGTFEAKASGSTPITDTLGIGFALMRSTHDGYVKDEVLDRRYSDKDTDAARVTLAWDPASTIRVDLAADISADAARMNVGRPVNDLYNAFYGAPAFAAFWRTYAVDNPVNEGQSYDWTGRTTPGLPNSTKLLNRGGSATIAADLTPALTVKSITALRKLDTDDFIDIDATQYELGDVFVGVDQKQLSQEVQLVYASDRLNAVVGAFYMKEDVDSHQEAYADDFVKPVYRSFLRTIDDELTTKSLAAFANASYEIVDNLRLSAGVRWTRETKDYDRTTSVFYNDLFTSKYDFLPPRGKWKDVSPMASIDYQITPSWMVYGRVAKGFKSGGFNGRANSAAESSEYDPEKALSYEAGIKGRLANTANISLAAFTTDYKNFQARVSGTDVDPVTGIPSAKLAVLNAGKLRIRGLEFEGNWAPVTGLLLDTQIGLLDSKYLEFDDATFTTTGGSRAFQDPAFSPKWTMRFGAQYDFDLGTGGSITLGGQERYKGRHALAIDNTFANSTTKIDGLYQDGYWLTDARIVWESPSKHYSVGVYGNNLTNKKYKTDGQEFSSIGGIRTVYYGAPRTIMLRLGAKL